MNTQPFQASLAKWLNVRLQTKWLRVRILLQSLKFQMKFQAKNSLTFRKLLGVDAL